MAVALFVTFAGFGILGTLYFLLDGDTARKERIHPPFVIGTGVLFLAGMLAADTSVAMVLTAVPAVLLISWANIRNTRFCHSCGRTNYNVQWWTRPRFCSACGSELGGSIA